MHSLQASTSALAESSPASAAAPVAQSSAAPVTPAKPAADVAAPVSASKAAAAAPVAADLAGTEGLDVKEGWSLLNYVVFAGFAVGFGALLWYLGGDRLVKRILAGRNLKGRYSRVSSSDV